MLDPPTHTPHITHNVCTVANWRGLLNLFAEHIRNGAGQYYVFSLGLTREEGGREGGREEGGREGGRREGGREGENTLNKEGQ